MGENPLRLQTGAGRTDAATSWAARSGSSGQNSPSGTCRCPAFRWTLASRAHGSPPPGTGPRPVSRGHTPSGSVPAPPPLAACSGGVSPRIRMGTFEPRPPQLRRLRPGRPPPGTPPPAPPAFSPPEPPRGRRRWPSPRPKIGTRWAAASAQSAVVVFQIAQADFSPSPHCLSYHRWSSLS